MPKPKRGLSGLSTVQAIMLAEIANTGAKGYVVSGQNPRRTLVALEGRGLVRTEEEFLGVRAWANVGTGAT